jgi:hypothetical protein
VRWLLASLASAGLLLGATTGAAQQRPARSGFWLELGGGVGSIRVACSGCEDITRASGSSGYARIGGLLTRKVLLGIESFGFSNEAFAFSDQDESLIAELANVAAIVVWFPWDNRIFLKGGLGLASGRFTVQPTEGEEQEIDGVGVGLTFGMGYDLPLRKWLSLTLSGSAVVAAIGDLVLPTQRVEDVIPTMYQLTLGFTVR